MRGAGGTNGGIGTYLLGLAMMCGGFYLLFNSIVVSSRFGTGYRVFTVPAFGSHYPVTSGMLMIPFIFGVVMIFYNGRNYFGWLLALGSLLALIFGVLASVNFSFRHMTAFDLIVILVLCAGGTGLLLRSLRSNPPADDSR